jgi:invasion protein IalB
MIPMIRTFRSLPAIVCLVATVALAVALQSAAAQGIKRIGAFGDWSSFQFTEDGNTACYMSSEPQKAVGKYKKRGEIYAIVTHRPAENRIGEVSIVAGYSYQKDSTVEITIGKQAFDLFTQDDAAWAPDGDTDKQLVQAMKKGSKMVVKGTSARGTLTTDTYSLTGFTKAYRAISKACGL